MGKISPSFAFVMSVSLLTTVPLEVSMALMYTLTASRMYFPMFSVLFTHGARASDQQYLVQGHFLATLALPFSRLATGLGCTITDGKASRKARFCLLLKDKSVFEESFTTLPLSVTTFVKAALVISWFLCTVKKFKPLCSAHPTSEK